MKSYQNLKLSIKALLINKSRTYFTIAGMGVGIAAVVTTVSIGDAAKLKALELIEAMGTNVIVVNAGKYTEVFGRAREVTNVTTLKLEDAEDLSDNEHITKYSALAERSLTVKYQDNTTNSLIQGIMPNYSEIRNYSMNMGTFFTEIDNSFSAKKAVLGSQVLDKLFKNENPINKTILINNIPFIVVGTFDPIGTKADVGNIDNIVMIPVKTMLRRVQNIDFINKVYLQVDKMENMDMVENFIIDKLRINHKLNDLQKKDDFTIINQLNAIRSSKESSRAFNLLILGVAIISLIIGGAGILAVMILTVRERINEIGLRISVGAKKRNIIFQFLSESLLISSSGGLVGIIVGCFTALLVNKFTEWPTFVSTQSIVIPFLFSIFTGVIFGVFPAMRAAKLDPINALKTE